MPLSTAEFFFSRRILRSSITATIAIRQIQPIAAISSAAKVPAQPVRPEYRASHRQSFPDLTWQSCHQSGKQRCLLIPSAAPIAFLGTKPTAATPINNCGAKDQETQRKERSQIDIFVTGMLIHTERGDNQRQRDAGHQATATVRQVREPAPQAAYRPAHQLQTGVKP
ncbi:Uncharacterised protein [Escherichia coli]|uniref:Uncharacterized protein n=1 Tax=Escherichia coli TaxID=562 RepID=A0A377AII6_ECOLX|nr:Uncharacterised protein [Escherichia coli]